MNPYYIVMALIAASVMPSSSLWAGSEVVLGQQAPADQQVSIDKVDHAVWDALLHKYCDANGMVNYSAWQKSQQDQQALDQYLAHLSHADPNLPATHDAKLAFWINAYNAVTIRGILREYPTTSIRNHTAKLFGYNIWDDLLLPVDNRTYSLRQIEDDVLRKMGDPRIHFAIVCASIGCPPLLDEAYTAKTLDAQLTANAKRFFADPKKFRYNAAQRRIEVSPILKWFAEDFGVDQAAQLRTIVPFLPDQAARALALSGQANLSYLDYDWKLNDQARK